MIRQANKRVTAGPTNDSDRVDWWRYSAASVNDHAITYDHASMYLSAHPSYSKKDVNQLSSSY